VLTAAQASPEVRLDLLAATMAITANAIRPKQNAAQLLLALTALALVQAQLAAFWALSTFLRLVDDKIDRQLFRLAFDSCHIQGLHPHLCPQRFRQSEALAKHDLLDD